MELDGNWTYTSFDRHTSALAKVGVPTLGTSATPFQQNISNLNVASNVAGIVTGTGLTGGNIEFWGGDYSAPNALGILNASATLYDFGDTMSTAGGHGSLQVHNHDASQTIFAYNNWGSTGGQISALGIGNNPNAGSAGQGGTQAQDWTFTASATNYTTRNLYVLVRPGGGPGGLAPVFYSHPASQTVSSGGSATLTALVSGTGPFTYQWRKNNTPLPGKTNPWLELNGLGVADAGTYDVVVTGANLASSTSLAGVISVNPVAKQVSIVINGDGTVDVLFHGIPGRSYQIQRSPDLLNWTLQQTLNAASDGNLPFHDPAPPAGTGFYRARETP
jgi:hypothetical protein